MVEGHRFEAWNHTAQLLVALCEPYRDTKKHPRQFVPAEFHPYANGRASGHGDDRIPPMEGTFKLMKQMWVDEDDKARVAPKKGEPTKHEGA